MAKLQKLSILAIEMKTFDSAFFVCDIMDASIMIYSFPTWPLCPMGGSYVGSIAQLLHAIKENWANIYSIYRGHVFERVLQRLIIFWGIIFSRCGWAFHPSAHLQGQLPPEHAACHRMECGRPHRNKATGGQVMIYCHWMHLGNNASNIKSSRNCRKY